MNTPAATVARPIAPLLGRLPWGWLICLALTVASVAAIRVLGVWALVLPVYGVTFAAAVLYPRGFAMLLLGAIIAIEPSAIDFTKPLSWALYTLPPELESFFPITVSPLEVLIALTALSLAVRPSGGSVSAPRLTALVPVLVAGGLVYGLARGGDVGIAYNEARGLIFGMVAYVMATRFGPRHARALPGVLFAGTTVLSLITITRYWFYVRDGSAPVGVEHAFAHDSAVFLGIGFVAATAMMLKARGGGRTLLLLHNLLIVGAMMTSGRRSAMLMLLVAAMLMAFLLFPKRPGLVVALALPALVFGGAYMVSYWNVPDGTLAQPARAIRSQIDPSPRDRSSDAYREDEIVNLTETLRGSPVLGVGFGNPFEQVRELPDLTSFWPLQLYTSHQNILWLWLKMGIAGISVMLGIWTLAFARCLRSFRAVPRTLDVPVLPLVLAAALMMYLSYARIDIAFANTRSVAPLAIVVALAFSLPRSAKEEAV